MPNLTELTNAHYQAIREARANMKGCPVCHGKPHITYEPGCLYTICKAVKREQREVCPCKAAAPDMETDTLIEEIHRKIDQVDLRVTLKARGE